MKHEEEKAEQSITEKLQDIGIDVADQIKDCLYEQLGFDTEAIDRMDISDRVIIITSLVSTLCWDNPELWEACKVQEEN